MKTETESKIKSVFPHIPQLEYELLLARLNRRESPEYRLVDSVIWSHARNMIAERTQQGLWASEKERQRGSDILYFWETGKLRP